MKNSIIIQSVDTVAVALQDLGKGTICTLNKKDICLVDDIPQGHKFSITDIPKDYPVIKYGNSIGYATKDIKKGQWVHTHNIRTGLNDVLTYTYKPMLKDLISKERKQFLGFRRKNGKIGVRNEIWIIPTVGCMNSVAKEIEKQSQIFLNKKIDAICAYCHPYGCSQMGEDQEYTRKILTNLIQHPNAGGVLVLGLGCENSNVAVLKTYLSNYDSERIRFLEAQSIENEVDTSLEIIKELANIMQKDVRKPIYSDELIIGLKCGGSDGLSGITANPTVGIFSDYLISQGGTTVLTEVPEMFGAESILMNRCINEEVFNQTVLMINQFKEYYKKHNLVIYENPSPGNKKGGISTLEDKSLGCIQKAGKANVVDVLKYGESVTKKGLNLLSAPGNDLVASTALAASGCQIILFTTGRGTPFGGPVPTIKISSNLSLSANKKKWIDFDCGKLVKNASLDYLGQQLFEFVQKVSSGEKVKSEIADYHDMAIFKQGVTL